MSRGFVKEGDQEDIPVVTPRAFLPAGMTNYVTHEGLEALWKEMKQLQAELEAAGNNYILQNHIKAKIGLLQERISSAVEVTPKANEQAVSFGCYVSYNDRTIRIVGVDEADVSKGLVSFVSPIAKALTGKKKGDHFEMKIPRGTETIIIKEVSATPLPLTTLAESREKSVPKKQEAKAPEKEQKSQPTEIEQTDIHKTTPLAQPEEEVPSQTNVFSTSEDPMKFLPIVNERGNIVGHAQHCKIHNGSKLLHPVAHLLVNSTKGELLGRYWWHVSFGETPETAIKRNALSSLGLNLSHPKPKKSYIRETKTEKELVYTFLVTSDNPMPPTPDDETYLQVFAKDF